MKKATAPMSVDSENEPIVLLLTNDYLIQDINPVGARVFFQKEKINYDFD